MGGHKKDKKKHKKSKKKSKRKTSGSEDSSEEEVWVEKDSKASSSREEVPAETDDWLANADQLFATITREKPKEKEKNKPERPNIDEMGRTSRELNPYWKDGGTGLPQEASGSGIKTPGTVGDLGLGWLRKALDRAKQTAIEEKIPLEDVVAPVWGSLDKLLNSIKEAENKMKDKSYRPKNINDMSNKQYGSNRNRSQEKDDRGFRRPESDDSRNRHFHRRDDDRPRSFRKPSEGDADKFNVERRSDDSRMSKFRRSNYDRNNDHIERLKNKYKDSRTKSWKKPSFEDSRSNSPPKHISPKEERLPSLENVEDNREELSPKEADVEEREVEEQPEIITQDEMNRIAAEVLRAEMFGNEDEVKELKEKLRKAQAWLSGGGKSKSSRHNEVILTQTNTRGFTQPLTSSSSSQPTSKKRTKVETHKDGKRVRYFADDDRHSLQDLVHQEKLVSAADQNEMYTKLAVGTGQKPGDDDFEEGGGREKTDEWADFSRRQRAALDSTKREKALDSCKFCLDSDTVNRRLIISLMDKVYLSVPPYQSLTDGHCLIMPIQHVTCATLLDEDVWEEIMDLRRLVVKMFLEEDKDVIFYESAKNLNKFPHMVLHCIPVSRETGDEAPIYFKKALLECETEWSNNKKVIDLKGRDVRKAVPKGLSYFAVDFGLQSGFAHVIEDERLFPKNFAEEIIGGMMDIHHSFWRKQKKDDQQVQIAKTQEFIKKFKEFTSKKQF